jgi:hypothetical protein
MRPRVEDLGPGDWSKLANGGVCMSYVVTSCFWQVVDHWQTLIAGAFALVAGSVAYLAGLQQARATTRASNDQIAAAARKDRLQARCIAVGISPELLQLEAAHGRAQQAVSQFATLSGRNTAQIIAEIQDAKIQMPPVLSRVIDQVYILGEPTGSTVLQMISVIHQFNYMIDRIRYQILQNPNYFNPAAHQQHLSGQLTLIGQLIPMAQNETAPLHDEATSGVY